MGFWGRVVVGIFGVTLVLSIVTSLYVYRDWLRSLVRIRRDSGRRIFHWTSTSSWRQPISSLKTAIAPSVLQVNPATQAVAIIRGDHPGASIGRPDACGRRARIDRALGRDAPPDSRDGYAGRRAGGRTLSGRDVALQLTRAAAAAGCTNLPPGF
jgi:hypothetical protein